MVGWGRGGSGRGGGGGGAVSFLKPALDCLASGVGGKGKGKGGGGEGANTQTKHLIVEPLEARLSCGQVMDVPNKWSLKEFLKLANPIIKKYCLSRTADLKRLAPMGRFRLTSKLNA